MKLSEFTYHLPLERIAQEPVTPRDHSRVLILDKKSSRLQHRKFFEIEKFLQPGDVLVINDSKVIPARLLGRKKETGGKLEVFLLKEISPKTWEVLIGGHGRREGVIVKFGHGLEGKVVKKLADGVWHFRFNLGGKKFKDIIRKIGLTPTPPYIRQRSNLKKYQTVYAQKEGSVAAPTAGFHFTKKLINRLKKKGVQFECVTLHVGLGTFQSVKVKKVEKHRMHPEFVEVKKDVIRRLLAAKKEGRRIIAVGTTSVRVLETVLPKYVDKKNRGIQYSLSEVPTAVETKSKDGAFLQKFYPSTGSGYKIFENYKGWVDTFIYPGYKFRFTDAMITNFHLPESTLIMLVAAFAGRKKILQSYETAKREGYRFYSFGDAMFIY